MDRREIALSVITGEPVGDFTGHLTDALALLDGQVPFIGVIVFRRTSLSVRMKSRPATCTTLR